MYLINVEDIKFKTVWALNRDSIKYLIESV